MSPRARKPAGRRRHRRRRPPAAAARTVPAPAPPRRPRDLRPLGVAVLILGAAGAAIWRFFPLFEPIHKVAKGRLDFFTSVLLPILLWHLGAAIAVWLAARRRGWAVALYVSVSSVVLLLIGGPRSLITALEVAAYAVVAIGIGYSLTSRILRSRDRRWPVALAFGIVATSIIASILGTFHAFRGWLLAIALIVSGAAGTRRFLRRLRRSMPLVRRSIHARWSLASVFAVEGSFWLAGLVWILASPPEHTSDGLRLYLPLVKDLAHFHHLDDVPFPWSAVIPESGPAYSASLLALFGVRALRYAMPLCLLTLAALVAYAGRGRLGRAFAASIGIAVASIPVIMATGSSLMNEAFVSLCVVAFAWVTVRAPSPADLRVAVLLGALGGAAVGAKYTTLAYLGPFGIWAMVRAGRSGLRSVLRLVAGAGGGALLTFLPWMWQAGRLVGNPFFPFLSRWIPTGTYPNGLGKANLDIFRLGPGWTAWLRAPFDLTYSTSRYLESFSGNLGLAFLLVFAASVALLVDRRRRLSAPFILAALAGTAALWVETAYVRYWVPSVWLLALAAAVGWTPAVRSALVAGSTAIAALALLLVQFPVALSQMWLEPDGLPWMHYAGIVSDAQFEARMHGVAPLLEFSRSVGEWPTVIETGIDGCANIEGSCVEVAFWHFGALVNVRSPEQALDLARRIHARYWAIDVRSGDAAYFDRFGMEKTVFRPDRLAFRSKDVCIYRIPD